jgi:hypothetical protein
MKRIIFSLSLLALGFGSKAQEGKLVQQVNFNAGKSFYSFL